MRPLKKGRGRPRVEGLGPRRREQILAAATTAFARRGYPSTDLQALADSLGMGKGTVYRYFPSKKALFLAAADRGMKRMQARVDAEAAAARDPLDRITRAARAYLRYFHANPDVVELFVQERAEFRDRPRPTYFAHRDAHVGPWKVLLRGLMRSGRLRRMPVARIVDAFNSAFYGVLFTNYFEGRRRNPDRQAREMLDVLFRGILGSNAGPRPRVREARPRGDRHA